ncbi:amino acid transporter [Byssothecium circinans]|uniref:Amino acid transporter n=1 Tax=Byssothecium circinans TaxID=147558 RepID=A0A6A5TC49_9PLEO|nr:amino acid transporter [Byssothecium circinans]
MAHDDVVVVEGGGASDEKQGTHHDELDMQRIGKEQQLRRSFRFSSIFSYSMILGNTWELVIAVIGISLTNGGTAGGIWMFLIVCVGYFFVVLSMAEMASMAPTAGGQYHWVSELAPPSQQKFLSYLVGWMCVIGWQAGIPVTSFAATQQLQGLIALNAPSYVIKGWHSTLLTIAVAAFGIIWNTVFVRKLPMVEIVVMVLHIAGFFAVVVVLWAIGPRSDPTEVWTNFEDSSGWGSKAVAALVGMSAPILTLVGSDSTCHMSEEIENAAWVLPRAMVATSISNYALGFITTVTIMSRLGSSIPELLSTPFGQPWIQVFRNATNSKAGTSAMAAVLFILLVFCTINMLATTSRQMFAFARDRGLPFSDALAKVHPRWNIPVNAILLTILCTTLLSLIMIGSSIAFNVITSLGQVGLISSYLIAIGCMLAKRLRREQLLPSRFDLGRSGIFVNGIALSFLSVAFTFSFFPLAPRPSAESANWSCLLFGFIVGFSLVYYYLFGRRAYVGPVVHVKRL